MHLQLYVTLVAKSGKPLVCRRCRIECRFPLPFQCARDQSVCRVNRLITTLCEHRFVVGSLLLVQELFFQFAAAHGFVLDGLQAKLDGARCESFQDFLRDELIKDSAYDRRAARFDTRRVVMP